MSWKQFNRVSVMASFCHLFRTLGFLPGLFDHLDIEVTKLSEFIVVILQFKEIL